MFERFAGDPSVTRFVGWPRHQSVADTIKFLEFSDAQWARWPAGPYLIASRSDGRLLGSTGLGFEEPDRASTGYVLAKDAWGQGYATEALHAMVDLAWRVGVVRLYALCHPEHPASWRVLEKCGFGREATWPRHSEFPNLAPGVRSDVLCYVVNRRDALIAAILNFLAEPDAQKRAEIRAALERKIDEAGPDALVRLGVQLATAGADWDYYPPDLLARRIHYVLADRILQPDSALFGIEHLAAVAEKPVVIFANHLSYSDANLLEILLHRGRGAALADRLTVVAGPKVYSSSKRRFSSLCFGTIKIPQSSTLSTEDAVMNPREVARGSRRSIDIAHERLRLGDALLVFAEGTRSRTNGMQQMLTGVTRYLDGLDTLVLPVGITGTEALFPIGEDTLHPVRIVARVGRPFSSGVLRDRAGGNRRLMMDSVGLAIAAVLPPDYRGAYGDQVAGLDDARRLLDGLCRFGDPRTTT